MVESVFPYPGGKTSRVNWIEQHIPSHRCYVEPFGGSAAVLVNTPPSDVMVYNDINGDLVHFFKTLRDSTNELLEWLELTPYSRELYEEYAEAYYAGDRPGDDIERAGKFFYLRCTQWGGKIGSKAGFATKKSDRVSFITKPRLNRLKDIASLFEDVIIENESWPSILKRYDGGDTFVYCDPPYHGTEGYYVESFDHEALASALHSLDGYWALSYSEHPPAYSDCHVRELDRGHKVGNGKSGSATDATEHLIMNYDPETTPKHSSVGQATLGEVSGGE